jgi:hypothetical protein
VHKFVWTVFQQNLLPDGQKQLESEVRPQNNLTQTQINTFRGPWQIFILQFEGPYFFKRTKKKPDSAVGDFKSKYTLFVSLYNVEMKNNLSKKYAQCLISIKGKGLKS